MCGSSVFGWIDGCKEGVSLNCVFCAIACGDIPAHTVLENDHVIAFLDVHPAAEGHVLVVPKTHVQTLPDLPDDVAGPLMAAIRRVAAALVRGRNADGINVLNASGSPAGQTVYHVHFHVIPRHRGDSLHLHVPAFPEATNHPAMEAEARAIRDALTTVP
jgi:histidine triad (HIT) family protein